MKNAGSVRIKPEKGVRLQPTSTGLHPPRQSDGTVLWEIDNQNPADDVTVEIPPVHNDGIGLGRRSVAAQRDADSVVLLYRQG